jgi:hypothetical protein
LVAFSLVKWTEIGNEHVTLPSVQTISTFTTKVQINLTVLRLSLSIILPTTHHIHRKCIRNTLQQRTNFLITCQESLLFFSLCCQICPVCFTVFKIKYFLEVSKFLKFRREYLGARLRSRSCRQTNALGSNEVQLERIGKEDSDKIGHSHDMFYLIIIIIISLKFYTVHSFLPHGLDSACPTNELHRK